MAAAEAEGAEAVVIEAIKLVESGLAEVCDEVWLVTCDPDVQRSRLIERGTSPDDASDRIAAQVGFAGRVGSVATRVIDASGESGQVRAVIEAAFDALSQRRSTIPPR
jgi:dephospho-CoA kinase